MGWRRAPFAVATSAMGITLAIACGSDETASTATTAAIGPSGGTVRAGGVVLEIPPGAVDRDVTIGVTADAPLPDGFRIDGANYHFEPAGLVFSKEVSITFPTGRTGESVFWTITGALNRYERLPTEVADGLSTTRVRHFSNGFVGATAGVTCTTKRRVFDGAACTQSTTVESPVHLWLVPTSPGGDPEGAMATDSPGIHALYNNIEPNAPFFFAKDATHALYRGYEGGGADFGTATRSGNVASFTLDAARGGVPPAGADCESVPLIAVACSGTVELGAPTASGDAGVPQDAGGAADARTVDAAFDADAAQGITCISKRRVYDGMTCSQSTTTESPVHLWLVPTSPGGDPEGAMATDSPGIHALYNNSDPSAALFFATDATHTLYNGYQGGGSDFGTAHRSGSAVSFTLDAARGGIVPIGCETVPLIAVTCSGATTLGP